MEYRPTVVFITEPAIALLMAATGLMLLANYLEYRRLRRLTDAMAVIFATLLKGGQ